MEQVRELVRKGQFYSSEYKGILANHLPMALFSLAGLGAPPERLSEFYEKHIPYLEPKPVSDGIVNSDNWQRFMGQHRLHRAYVDFFKEQYESLGQSRCLMHFLPVLLQAPGSGAFHGMIRTAYGLDFNEPSEVIEGLAYWAVSFSPIKYHGATAPVALGMAVMLLRDAFQDPEIPKSPEGKNIIERMEQIGSNDRLSDYIYGLTITPQSLGELSAAMLELYAATQNFTILHGVTATHALRVLFPFLSNTESCLRNHWAALLVAALTIPMREETLKAVSRCGGELLKTESMYTWDEIRAAAIGSNDDHVCKFVYTCIEEHEVYGWPLYRAVAAQKAGLSRDATASVGLEDRLAC